MRMSEESAHAHECRPALLLLYSCFTPALLLLYYTPAVPHSERACTSADLLYYCFTTALLLLNSCFTKHLQCLIVSEEGQLWQMRGQLHAAGVCE